MILFFLFVLMKKIVIVLILPLFVLLTGCGPTNVSDNDINTIEKTGNIEVLETTEKVGNILETWKNENVDMTEEDIEEVGTWDVEEDITVEENSNLDDSKNIWTGELEEKFNEIEDLFDEYSDDITGDSVNETDIEIMYKLIDILTTDKE